MILGIQWYYKRVMYLELLPTNKSFTFDLYCQQLYNSARVPTGKCARNGPVRFLDDNGHPDSERVTQKKVVDIFWEALPHLPHKPNLRPIEHHLIPSLLNEMQGEKLDDEGHLNELLTTF